MRALDTSVLVRYITQDDPHQAEIATELIENELSSLDPGFISTVVLAELIWVLRKRYASTRPELTKIVSRLLSARQLVLEHDSAVGRALRHTRVDLADAIIHEVGRRHGCSATVTFDRAFAGLPGVELLDG